MGCVPGSIAGVVRGSVLFIVGVLTDSRDTRHLGRQVILGNESQAAGSSGKSPYEELAEFKSMRRELDQWREDLVRCKAEGSTAGIARLQQLMEKREAELRDMEAKHKQLELDTRNYPPPAFLLSDGFRSMTNVGVVGGCGVGKSLLVNSMRNVRCGDPGHAPVGPKQSTASPTMYTLPNEPHVRLWDLPGAGSRDFPRDMYPRAVGLRHLDVVLLVTGCRFTQMDLEIFRGLCEQGVPTLVVRTMIDLDVANGLRDSQQKPEDTLKSIADDLKSKGILHPYLVNARCPEEHDFPRMMIDLQKALAVSAGSPCRAQSWHSYTEEHVPEPGGDAFQAGDEAEVVVLAGAAAGMWARCVVTGPGTRPDCYAISLPDAPPEKQTVLNVHISALRPRSGPCAQKKVQLLELETVKEILLLFREVCNRQDIQTTLAAIDKQGPVTKGVRMMKRRLITDTLSSALSRIDLPIPREISPLLMQCIQSYQDVVEVRDGAHEVESLLTLGIGELFGIPQEVNGHRARGTGGRVSIRDTCSAARRLSGSLRLQWLLFACAFLDVISFAALPGALLQPVVLVFRTYAHFQRSRGATASALDRAMVPLVGAMGSALACAVACVSAREYGQDLMVQLPASMSSPSTAVARSAIEKLGAIGVFAYIMVVGPSASLPAILYALVLGCQALNLVIVSFIAGFVRLLLDLEVLLGVRAWLLQVVPFAQSAETAEGEWKSPLVDAIVQRLAMGKKALEGCVGYQRDVASRIVFGLMLLSTVSSVGNCTIRYLAMPLKYALHCLHSVQDSPSKWSSMLAIPAVDGAATAAGALLVQLLARLRGAQAVAHLIPETGWERAKGAVEGCGSLGAGLGALLGASPAADPMLAALAGAQGCGLLLAPLALFAAVTLRSLIFLEGNLAVIKGCEELTTPAEQKDE